MPKYRKTFLPALLLLQLCLLLGSCSTTPAGAAAEDQYDANSWKTLIAEDCMAFFDGCNNCRRAEGSVVAACTRMACAVYQKPRCLDEPINEGSIGKTPFEGRLVRFACDDDRRFSINFDEYVSGDQRVKLAEDEIMLSDPQTHSAHMLKRDRAASGAKYSDGSLEFWEHGGDAMLRKDGQKLYQNCAVAG